MMVDKIKPWIKKGSKALLLGLVALLLPPLLYLLAALVLSLLTTSPPLDDCPKVHDIYLSSNGIHLDILIARKLVGPSLLRQLDRDWQSKYLGFGWGDQGFYLDTPTWAELKLETLVAAVFLKSESAMHVTSYFRLPADAVRVRLCASQLERLRTFIEASFEKNPAGATVEIPDAGYTPHDFFYRAHGSYSGINTCNEWVNDGLKSAGLSSCIWSPFDWGILYQMRNREPAPE